MKQFLIIAFLWIVLRKTNQEQGNIRLNIVKLKLVRQSCESFNRCVHRCIINCHSTWADRLKILENNKKLPYLYFFN